MLWLVLSVLGGSPCDSAQPAPRVPLPSEFLCPGGATAQASGTGIECLGRDGRPTGDTFAVEGRTGLMVHPLGLSLAWDNGVVSWWHLRPTGQRVAYEGGRPTRIEYFEGGELQCAKHFEGARLSKRFDDGKWSWLDKQ